MMGADLKTRIFGTIVAMIPFGMVFAYGMAMQIA